MNLNLDNLTNQLKRPEVLIGLIIGLLLVWQLMKSKNQRFLPSEYGIAITNYGSHKIVSDSKK